MNESHLFMPPEEETRQPCAGAEPWVKLWDMAGPRQLVTEPRPSVDNA